MEKLKIEYISKEQLRPYARNAKIHTKEQISQIQKSILEFGFNDPIAIWKENEVIEGHGRLLAVMQMKDISDVPVIRLDGLTEEQRKAYTLVHNKLTMNTDFDVDILNVEIESIEDIDMSEFGFDISMDDEEDAKIEITEDEYTEDAETRCKYGDIWKLGDHKLICGDSTDPHTFQRLIGEEKAKMLFTSPPYSDMRDYNGGKELSVDHVAKFITACRPYTDYMCVNLGIQRKDHEVVQYWDEYIKVARSSGYKLMSWNVWDKGMTGNIGQAKAFFHLRHEFVFVFGTEFFEINLTIEKKPESIIKGSRKKTKRNKDGTTELHTCGDMSKKYKQMESVLFMHPVLDNNLNKLHPAPFPIGLPAEYIKAMTSRGDAVIEPFGGSGTTLMACEQLGRKCFISEMDQKYCDVILKRWEDYTGQKSELVQRVQKDE